MTYTNTYMIPRTVEIDKEQARNLIVEARINVPNELDVYESGQGYKGYLRCLFTLSIPNYMSGFDKEALLEYARQNIPDTLNFGR